MEYQGNPVHLAEWEYGEVLEEVQQQDLGVEDINEILNGQAQLVDRAETPEADLNTGYLALVYSLEGEAWKQRLMDIYHEDMDKMLPPEYEDKENLQPVNLHMWDSEVDGYRLGEDRQKVKHHLAVVDPLERKLVAHYTTSEYVDVETKD